MMVFMEGGKRENTRKTLDARREPTSNSTQMCHRTEIELGAPILLPKGLECMFRTLATNFSNTPKSVDRAASTGGESIALLSWTSSNKGEINFFDVFYSLQYFLSKFHL